MIFTTHHTFSLPSLHLHYHLQIFTANTLQWCRQYCTDYGTPLVPRQSRSLLLSLRSTCTFCAGCSSFHLLCLVGFSRPEVVFLFSLFLHSSLPSIQVSVLPSTHYTTSLDDTVFLFIMPIIILSFFQLSFSFCFLCVRYCGKLKIATTMIQLMYK